MTTPTTPEQVLVAAAIQSWTSNVERAGKMFAGLTDRQLLVEVAPGRNRLVYLWGHLIAVHDGMLPLLGIGPRLHPDLDETFLAKRDRDVGELPVAAELKQQWDEVNGRLLDGFRQFSPSDWVHRHNAVSEEDFATNPLRNRLSVLLSRSSHLAYHLGQAVLAAK
jgi:hypothetical protein